MASGLNLRSGSPERQHPAGELRSTSTRTTSCRPSWARTTSSSFGGYWRDAVSWSNSHTGGFATARFPTAARPTTAPDRRPGAARSALTRDGSSAYGTTNIAAYVQDSVTQRQADAAARRPLRPQAGPGAWPRNIAANPIGMDRGRTSAARRSTSPASSGHRMQQLLAAAGHDLDLQGNGKTIAKANYARYYGQVGTGSVAGEVNPVSTTTVRYPWTDLNGDKAVRGERDLPDQRRLRELPVAQRQLEPVESTRRRRPRTRSMPNLQERQH